MEGILALVSLTIAAPGTIIAVAQCGEYIDRKVSSFRNAPEVARELGRFGRELHRGKLKISVELAGWAYSLPDLDPVMKDAIEDHVDQLQNRLREIEFTLDKLFDKNGEVRRIYYAMIGERKAERVVRSLKEWEHEFSNTLSIIEMKKRVLPSDLHLTRDRYRCRGESQLDYKQQFYTGFAEIMRGGEIQEFRAFVERKNLVTDDNNADLEEIARVLAELTNRDTFKGGVLRCVGYRISNGGELIFELPNRNDKPRTLRDIMLADQRRPVGGGKPLDDRLRLARSLCDTVVSVFTSGLVHKSIRTDTILLMQDEKARQQSRLGLPFLSSWTLLRKATGLTSGPGEGDHFTDFYRHPKRQGIQPEDRYNIGHDIYSLGVCLLEIGLWMSFFGADGEICALYRETALQMRVAEEADDDLRRSLTAPWVVTKVLPKLAAQELPPRMPNKFVELTIACLTCLEGGMGDAACFRRTPAVAAMRFNELLAQSFSLQ